MYNAVMKLYKKSLCIDPSAKHIRLFESMLADEMFQHAKNQGSKYEMFRYFKFKRKKFDVKWIPVVARLCKCDESDVLREIRK